MDKNNFNYIKLLLFYIEREYDNLPKEITKEMNLFLRKCSNKKELIPNAAGKFSEKFIYKNIKKG